MSQYREFMASTIECPVCKWVGPDAKMVMGESFGDGADKHYPVCDWRYGFVAWPMSHECQDRVH